MQLEPVIRESRHTVAVEDFTDEKRLDLDASNNCLSQKMVEAQSNLIKEHIYAEAEVNHNEQDAKAIEDQVNASYQQQAMFANTIG